MCVRDNRYKGSIFPLHYNIFDNCTFCFANHLKRVELNPSVMNEYDKLEFEDYVQVFLTEGEECEHIKDYRPSLAPPPAPANRVSKESSGPKKDTINNQNRHER